MLNCVGIGTVSLLEHLHYHNRLSSNDGITSFSESGLKGIIRMIKMYKYVYVYSNTSFLSKYAQHFPLLALRKS